MAWRLLRLRDLGRHLSTALASAVADTVQLQVLRNSKPKILGEDPEDADIFEAVAKLGGHLKRDRPLGWKTLGHGWDQTRQLKTSFRVALETQTEM